MSVTDIGKQAVSFVFNALALNSPAPKLFRVQPYPVSANLPGDLLDIVTAHATLQEVVTAETEISDHPVESSSTRPDVVSDNARNKPIEVRVDGIVTDSPITSDRLLSALQSVPPAFGFALGLVGATALSAAGLLSASIVQDSQQAYDALLRLHDQKQLVTVVTPKRSFTSMIMTSLTITRDQHTGQALRFAAAFKQIVTVSLKTVLMPDLAQQARDLGAQGTSAVQAAVQAKESAAIKLAKAAGVPLPPKVPVGATVFGVRFK